MGRFLVVDDDAESRNLLCEVLEANGYHDVAAVSDGLEARKVLERDGAYRIVIADLHMPNESGLDLLRNLRKRNARCEIVLMSSFISATERKLARDLGAYALLDKPFRLSDLLQVVSELAEKDPCTLASG